MPFSPRHPMQIMAPIAYKATVFEAAHSLKTLQSSWRPRCNATADFSAGSAVFQVLGKPNSPHARPSTSNVMAFEWPAVQRAATGTFPVGAPPRVPCGTWVCPLIALHL